MAFDAGSIKAKMVLDKSHFDKSVAGILKGQKNVAGQAKKTGSAFKSMWKQMAIGIGITGGITMVVRGLIRQMSDTIKTGRSFEKEWANVTTMLNISRSATEKMKHELRMLSPTLGDTTDLAKGMYQVLSASIEPSKAIRFLGEAAKSAKAGVTETKIAVDAMTTVINAYGMEAEAAGKISDDMFGIVKRGKLTYGELAVSLGTVVPVASTVGVKFEDVGAAIATLTRQGIPASKATMQLRQVFMAILKPSAEAEEITGNLGIAMGKNALEAKGLAGWLTELKEKTKGNADIITKIVPNVRALTSVLALTGKASKGFAYDQEFMADTLGYTDEAFKKQTESVDFWLETFKVATDKIKIAAYEGLVSPLRESIRTAEDFEEKVTAATNRTANEVSLHMSGIAEEVSWLTKAWKATDQFLFGWSDRVHDALNSTNSLAEAQLELEAALSRAGREAIAETGGIKGVGDATKYTAEMTRELLERRDELFAFKIDWEALKPPSELMARWDEFYNLVETPELDLIWEQQMVSMEEDTLNFMASIIPGMAFMTKSVSDDTEEMGEHIKKTWQQVAYEISAATSNLFSQIGGLSQAHFNNQLIALDKEKEAWMEESDKKYEAEREAIENSLMSEEEKAEALKALEEERIEAEEKRNEEYDLRKKAIQKKAFESHKKIQMVKAVIDIASAVIEALPNFILAGITAAAGAVQLATINAQTFPGLKEGGVTQQEGIYHLHPQEMVLPIEKAPALINEISHETIGGSAKVDFNFYAPLISTTGIATSDLDEITEDLFDRMEREANRRGYSLNGS